MCQTIAAKIVSVNGKNAIADFSGQIKEINVELVDIKEGDTVICSGNIAIEKVDEDGSK